MHPYKEDTLTLTLTKSPSAAAEAAAAAEFKNLDWPEVCRRANSLLAATRLDREFIWRVVVIAETLERGWSGAMVASIREGRVRKPQAYLDACLRKECQQRGLDYRILRELVPPPGRPKPIAEVVQT